MTVAVWMVFRARLNLGNTKSAGIFVVPGTLFLAPFCSQEWTVEKSKSCLSLAKCRVVKDTDGMPLGPKVPPYRTYSRQRMCVIPASWISLSKSTPL